MPAPSISPQNTVKSTFFMEKKPSGKNAGTLPIVPPLTIRVNNASPYSFQNCLNIPRYDFLSTFSGEETTCLQESWMDDHFLYRNTFDNIVETLQLSNLTETLDMELFSEDVLKMAAEMVVYLNFCSTKEVWFFSKLLHKKSVVQIILGICFSRIR